MLITTPKAKEKDIYQCPDCGRMAEPNVFKLKLPGVTKCIDGASVFYRVVIPGEDEPWDAPVPQSRDEIIKRTLAGQLVLKERADAEAKEAEKAKRAPKKKDDK